VLRHEFVARSLEGHREEDEGIHQRPERGR
jgi:hypothetical protein